MSYHHVHTVNCTFYLGVADPVMCSLLFGGACCSAKKLRAHKRIGNTRPSFIMVCYEITNAKLIKSVCLRIMYDCMQL